MDLVRLNVGSGGTKMEDYISVDLYAKNADIKRDCADIGFESKIVDEIFTSHMIEHINAEHFSKALDHWYYILKEDGKLTIRCPNAIVYLNEWLLSNTKYDWDYLNGWGTRNVLGWEGHGIGMLNRQLFSVKYLSWFVSKHRFTVISCIATETRVKNKKHIEYRKDGDILLEAIK